MIRFFRRLMLLSMAIVIVALMVANRHSATLALDPFAQGTPPPVFEAPMFVFLFVALLVGFLLGGLGAWASQSRWRDLARRRTKETYRLRKDRERLSRDLQSAQESRSSAVARLSAS